MVSHMTIYRVKIGDLQVIELRSIVTIYCSDYIDSSVCITRTINVNMQRRREK